MNTLFANSERSSLQSYDGGGFYLELAEFLSTRGSVRHRAADLRQLWARVAFNILTSNTDDHLRNHGFILAADGWRLAPAYDVNASIERSAHSLSIDANDPTPDVGLAVTTTPYYGIKETDARKILNQITQTVGSWKKHASALRIPREEIERMALAFQRVE